MHWDDMRVFLAVARGQSLSAAGRSLRMDPATVGRRIARLEHDTGAALFLKSPQGYMLSDRGTQLMPFAITAERAFLEATGAAGAENGGLSGQIRIGAPDGCANFLLPQVCARIGRDHPALDLHVLALPRTVNLTRREVDLAVSVSAPGSGRVLARKLADYALHFAASRAYLDRAPPITGVADLRHHPIVGYIPDQIFDSELDYLAELGVTRVAQASNSVAVQLNLLRQGAGVGIVHDFAMASADNLRPILPEITLKRSYYLLRHSDDRGVPRLDQISDLIAAGVRQEMAKLGAIP